MRINLTVRAGTEAGRTFSFDGHATFFVGRSQKAHFRLADQSKTVSRVHFMVEVNPPLCRLTDMGSTNGTALNGRKVKEADLTDGDVIRVGHTELVVSLLAEDAPPDDPGEGETRRLDAGPPAAVDWPTVAPPSRPTAPATTASYPGERTGPAEASVSCRSCSVWLPAGVATPGPGLDATATALCPDCRDRIRATPQTVPGYQIVRELGRGGMGVVYLALRQADLTRVALKTIKPDGGVTGTDVQRFLREASILAGLDHPYIVAFREMGEAGGVFHFAMDYVEGRDASRLQKEHGGPLPVGRAVALVCQLLQALDYAHAKGFVHRDVKPANLLVAGGPSGEAVRLSDFGLARVYQTSAVSGLTFKGDHAGTFAYMAPEQITDLREARPPVDQYSAAATLYRLLTDRHVYDLPKHYAQQIQTVLFEDPVPIRSRRPDLPEGLAAAVQKALAREPAARFADVAAFRRALLPFAG